MFNGIKRWFVLRAARKEAKKHIPTDKDIELEHNEFVETEKKAHKSLEKKSRKKKSVKKPSKSKSTSKKKATKSKK